jgi:hypothetical protein
MYLSIQSHWTLQPSSNIELLLLFKTPSNHLLLCIWISYEVASLMEFFCWTGCLYRGFGHGGIDQGGMTVPLSTVKPSRPNPLCWQTPYTGIPSKEKT